MIILHFFFCQDTKNRCSQPGNKQSCVQSPPATCHSPACFSLENTAMQDKLRPHRITFSLFPFASYKKMDIFKCGISSRNKSLFSSKTENFYPSLSHLSLVQHVMAKYEDHLTGMKGVAHAPHPKYYAVLTFAKLKVLGFIIAFLYVLSSYFVLSHSILPLAPFLLPFYM